MRAGLAGFERFGISGPVCNKHALAHKCSAKLVRGNGPMTVLMDSVIAFT